MFAGVHLCVYVSILENVVRLSWILSGYLIDFLFYFIIVYY